MKKIKIKIKIKMNTLEEVFDVSDIGLLCLSTTRDFIFNVDKLLSSVAESGIASLAAVGGGPSDLRLSLITTLLIMGL
jgi:hypothetical protein